MKRILITLILSLITAAVVAQKIQYPPTRTVEQKDVFHGVEVSDPYRWLEQDVRETKEVRDWIEAQNKVTFAYLESLPHRSAIEKRLTELWNYEKNTIPFKKGGRYYFSKNDGLQNQYVLYVQNSLEDKPRILIDPNLWSKDGTIALSGYSFSDDGRHIAYGVSDAGSDWVTYHVMEIESGKILPEEIKHVKFAGTDWTTDGKGFFYSRYPEPRKGAAYQDLNKNQKVYYHRVGTPQSQDVLVYARPEQPEWGFLPTVTEDGKYLVLTVWKGTDDHYQVHVRDLQDPYAMPAPLIDHFDNEYSFIGNDGPLFYFKTDLEAPRGKVIAIDLRSPQRESWKTIVPEAANVLDDVNYVGGSLVTTYLKDARSEVKIYDRNGRHLRDVELGQIGTVNGFAGRHDDPETFYSFASYNTPPSIYRYDVSTGEKKLMYRAGVAVKPEDYEVKQVFFKSKDGTRVPMFLVHRKGLKLDGNNPTLLYGYGGFNISQKPGFSVSRMVWLQMGGVLAIANLRGGGEYGGDWHKAGTKLQKQNVFDDFIAAAEWLIANRYTRPAKLAAQGGSNGGLLVGAVINQRPDLFGAALPAVGVMDMLRYQRFTAGRFWVDDYGSADNAEEFKAIYAYSPYHNLRRTDYPATLVTSADTDDRVIPAHSFKYAAALQKAHTGSDPVLIRIETRAGHGSGKPITKIIEEVSDQWAFLAKHLEMKLPSNFRSAASAKN